MDYTFEKIKKIADNGNGFIYTSQIENAGISRTVVKKYVDSGMLEQIRKGLYIPYNSDADEYAVLQARIPKAIFSYGTALYFWELSDRVPHIIDVTVLQGTNLSRLKKNNAHLRAHYVLSDYYDIGITETKSPQGGIVKLYDKERCICDLIRNKNQVEMQLYLQAVKGFFKDNKDNRKIIKYGKKFGIEEKIRTYMEVL